MCICPTEADKHLPPHGHPLYFWSNSQCVSLKGNLSCWSGRQAQERPLQCSTWRKWQVTHLKFTERVGVTLCIIVNFLLCSTAYRTQTQSGQHEPTEWHSWPTRRVSRQVTRNMDSDRSSLQTFFLFVIFCWLWSLMIEGINQWTKSLSCCPCGKHLRTSFPRHTHGNRTWPSWVTSKPASEANAGRTFWSSWTMSANQH